MATPRPSTVGLMVLAVIVAGISWLSLRSVDPPGFSEGGTSFVPPEETVRLSLSETLPESPRALIVGDSYADGTGADSDDTSWAATSAEKLGWDVRILGSGGTGYTWPGPNNTGTFPERIAKEAKKNRDYDVIVIEGSQNDYRSNRSEIFEAVTETLAMVQNRWPDAALIAFGPTAPTPLGPKLERMASPVQDAALASGAFSINPIEAKWLTEDNSEQYRFDNAHVNQAGHDYISQRFAEAVSALTLEVPVSEVEAATD